MAACDQELLLFLTRHKAKLLDRAHKAKLLDRAHNHCYLKRPLSMCPHVSSGNETSFQDPWPNMRLSCHLFVTILRLFANVSKVMPRREATNNL
jgi:hypothetical protein